MLNDLPGYGKVALGGMIPVLTRMGYRVFHLPTAIISNTLNYGKFEVLDTTDYMINTLKVWKEHGFCDKQSDLEVRDFAIDAISTGFILNHRQAEFIREFCKKQSAKGTVIFCDPIMADNGRLYNSISQQNIEDMRKLIQYADYCVPNYTEAVYLTDSKYQEGSLTEQEIFLLIDKVRKLGPKSVVITSACVNEKDAICGYDAIKKVYFTVYYDKIPIYVPGTGDLFLAVLMGEILKTGFLEDERIQPLEQSVKYAADVLWKLIDRNKDQQDYFKGIMVEKDLDVFC